MARFTTRCNLSAARFPWVSNWQARTIILPQHDMNFQKSAIFAGNDNDRDIGVPQVFYMQNVMPTEQGVQTVGYTQMVAPYSPPVTNFNQAMTLFDSGNKFLFSPAAGDNYVYDAVTLGWQKVGAIAGLPFNTLVTTAYVQGLSYIFYEGIGCFVYNFVTKTLDPVTLTGLSLGSVKGIVGSNGYLLAFNQDTLAWSSAANPEDFTPSLITGAGSGSVTDLVGIIVVAYQCGNGIIVYGTQNAVAARFTANVQFPFSFKGIAGSGGIRSAEHVSFEGNNETQYALTSAGLQELSLAACRTVLFETTDFLTCRIFEDYDDVTQLFTTTYLDHDLYVKLTVVASRYFVISYAKDTNGLTHAIVYDIIQKRWGKLKLPHVDCFEYPFPNLYGTVTYAMLLAVGDLYDDLMTTPYSGLDSVIATAEKPRKTVGFLQNDGTVKILTFHTGTIDCNGVLLLGKYQFLRGHMMQLLGFEVENVIPDPLPTIPPTIPPPQLNNFAAFVLPSLDGKTFLPAVTPNLVDDKNLVRRYTLRNTAENQTLLFVGSFNFVSAQITFADGGQIRK